LSSALATKLLQEKWNSRMVASWNADRHAVEEVRWPTRHFQFADETTKTDLAMGFRCRLLEPIPRRDSPS
jgi:hypothetical protein